MMLSEGIDVCQEKYCGFPEKIDELLRCLVVGEDLCGGCEGQDSRASGG